MKRKTKIGVAIGIALIVIGAILKEYSPPLLGDISSFIGAITTLYMLFSDQQERLIERQERMTERQERQIGGQERLIEGQERTTGILEEIRNLLR
jgi:hypothetical protein